MNYRNWLGFVACAALLGSACGDDSGKKDTDAGVDGGAGNGGTGGRPPRPDAGPGMGAEGTACAMATDCEAGLACVNIGYDDPDTGMPTKACARACTTETMAADCATGEECYNGTGMPADGYCVNFVPDEFGVCGSATTSLCQDRICLLFTATEGRCFELCTPSGEDGGVDDDAGVSSAECGSGRFCSSLDTTRGVCATSAARGDLCDPETGVFCHDEDLCVRDTVDMAHCYQDCTEGAACDEGTCMSGGTRSFCSE